MDDFDDSLFRNASERMERLRADLSDRAIEDLARDVLGRLSARARHTALRDDNHPDARMIADLSDALIRPDPRAAGERMRRLQERGVTLEVIYARYLGPAAERLGEMWDDDAITFVEVTIGVGRIHEVVNRLRRNLPTTRITHGAPVLFATVPGERHGLGIEMAADLFAKNGWDVHLLLGADQDEIVQAAGQMRAHVLGLSSGGRRTAAALTRLIHAVRLSTPEVHVLISGRIVTEEPDLIDAMQPDCTAQTIEEALQAVGRLCKNDA